MNEPEKYAAMDRTELIARIAVLEGPSTAKPWEPIGKYCRDAMRGVQTEAEARAAPYVGD